MKIKRLEICGFKSFVDKMILNFEQDITCIVGPNGCGKSNVVDAIRWVMGEQSAKNLRGRGMEDVIFNGSESRGPHGFAEVTLTFDNTAGIGPAEYKDYAEIAVTRRLPRGGEGEYFINKVPVRLMDVTNLFLGTGIGKRAYSIIEQGRIGFIVSSKPEDRRYLIEEAAGITKFKAKKKATERKIELTQQNLLRISDVVAELEKSLASLERQAQKAERYKNYRQELKQLEMTISTQRYFELSLQTASLSNALLEAQSHASDLKHALELSESHLETQRIALLEVGQEVERAQGVHYENQNQLKLSEQQRVSMQERRTTIAEQQQRTLTEIAAIEAQHASLAEEVEQLAAALEPLREQVQLDEQELGTRTQAWEAARVEADAAQGDVTRAQAGAQELRLSIARAESTLEGFERRLADATARRARLHEEAQENELEKQRLREHANALHARVEGLRSGQVDTVGRKEELEKSLENLRAAIRESDTVVEALRTEVSSQRSRLRSLEELQARFEGMGAGVRHVMTHASNFEGVSGLVADRIDCPPELSRALATVLGDRLQYVVVDDTEAAKNVIHTLKVGKHGRVTLMPKKGLIEHALQTAETPSGLADDVGVRGRFTDLVSYAGEDQAWIQSMLDGVWVVKSFDDALRVAAGWLSVSGAVKAVVTEDGDMLLADGTITGGQGDDAQAHVLDVRHEIRELHQKVGQLDTELTKATEHHGSLRTQIASHQALLEQARLGAHEAEVQAVQAEAELKRQAEKSEGLERRSAAIGEELAEIARLFEASETEQSGAKRVLEEQSVALRELEVQLAEAQGVLEACLQRVEEKQSLMTQVKVDTAARKQKLEGDVATLERMYRSRDELQHRKERLSASVSEWERQHVALGQQIAELDAAVQTQAETVVASEQVLSDCRLRYDALMQEVNEQDAELRTARQNVESAQSVVQTFTFSLKDSENALLQLLGQVEERYRCDLRLELTAYHAAALVDEKVFGRVDDLKRLLERMGEINLLAIEEFKERSERYHYLSAQKIDLEAAIAELEKAIRQMNRESRRLFKDTFEAVNERFKAVFPRMFGGGKAELKLTDSENILETGVDIVAQPPGKKLGSIDLMSGGEKALTAVSLIFAIFQYKPSPFCLLDEVDAPLDEANVGRFADSIREMTQRSQFILISHNKRTMEMADVLYGVTMETPGISKLVSVELTERDERRRRTGKANSSAEQPLDASAMN